eukprot:SAG22_NODE_6353_length_866_cov_1.701434_1_plen_95_part_00
MCVIQFFVGIWATESITNAETGLWKWKGVAHGLNIVACLIFYPLLIWYGIAVRSMARQVKEGALSKDTPKGVDVPQAVAVQATVVSNVNPVTVG